MNEFFKRITKKKWKEKTITIQLKIKNLLFFNQIKGKEVTEHN